MKQMAAREEEIYVSDQRQRKEKQTMSKYGRAAVKGILHTNGTKIVNGDNEEIILEGYGVGNWMNPEGFMIGGVPLGHESFTPEFDAMMGFNGNKVRKKSMLPLRYDRHRTVTSSVRDLCGEEYLKTFWKRWYANHLSEDDIRMMAELDLNSVRLVLNSSVLLKEQPEFEFDEEGFAVLSEAIDWCEKYGIYAILDMHAAPGGQAGCEFDDGYDNCPKLFYDEECWDRGVALWEEIARRFGNREIVGGYDLLNEPLSLPVDSDKIPKLGQFYDECIAAIRRHDKQHMFFLEPAGFARYNITFDHDYDPGYHNWAIHWHRYGFFPEINEITPYLLKGREYNVPVWIGEGGSSPEANAVFFNIVQEYGVGYALWCWKTAVGPMGVRSVGHVLPKDWNLVQDYFRGLSKPSYQKAIEIFDEYLENMKYEKCLKDFSAINKTRRFVPFDLPAVGYDHSEKNNVTFSGNWGIGNLLNYRNEDHTKMVWDRRYPEPLLWLDGMNEKIDPVKGNRNPMERLLLELSEEEFAVYFVRKAPEGCTLCIDALSDEGAEIAVYADDCEIGTINVPKTEGYDPVSCMLQERIPAGNEFRVRLAVKHGTVKIHKLHFGA